MAHDHEIYMILADTAVELRDADALRKYAPPLESLASRDNHRLYLAIAHLALRIGWLVNVLRQKLDSSKRWNSLPNWAPAGRLDELYLNLES